MKILITGGCGFVGSNLALYFKKKDNKNEVISFDNLRRRGSELNIQRLRNHDITFVHGDIRNEDDFDFLTDLDCIIDASAEPSVVSGLDGGQRQLININLVGTVNLLNLAVKFNASFIFLSTSRVYPIVPLNGINFTEGTSRFEIDHDQNLDGISAQGISEKFTLEGYRSFYGATKLAAEVLIPEYNKYADIKTVVNRFGVIAGPYQMGKVDQGVSVLWMARHFWKGKLGYFGYGGLGKQVRDILHIDDVCSLIYEQASNVSDYNGQSFNVGGGVKGSLSLLEMTKICEEITGNKIVISPVLQDREADIRIYVTDNSKLYEKSSWRPIKTNRELFEDIFMWIKNNENQLKGILN